MNHLSDAEIATVLERNGVAVLALSGQTYPYQVPMCYGYVSDRDLLVMQLTEPAESHKHRHLQASRKASVTVYEETEPGQTWRSVVLRGELVESAYGEAEQAFAALARNTQSVPNPISWADSTGRTDLTPYEFDIAERSGREFDI
ncbi:MULTISPECIES: pyridoxamine 5'-phosphate oxidase family protein [Salinibaculum]|uniref:pyridoxamine 5'-phosphate oxidase family protein n=1 Tax=Salinibaculum TaxID=2732368 RepID=UPI0030D3B2C1